MPKLSVTIVTLNEAFNLPDCLESVKWADEIVVVDSGSTDETIEIAKKYTDKVFYHPWSNYAAQKNWAIDQTSHPWTLSLDADERVTPPLCEEIQELLSKTPSCSGYRIARKNHFLGRWIRYGGWYPDYTIRLFEKGQGRFPDRAVHESLSVTGSCGHLENPITHYTYRTLRDYHERAGRYAALGARQMKKGGRSFYLFDLLSHPIWNFLKMYFFRQGFRDGLHGLLLALLYSYYTFLKYALLWEMKYEGEKQ